MTGRVGATVGHFEVLEEIGRGGMGVVYKARDTRLNRIVALKFLPETIATSEDFQRFEQEARTISSLAHKNIATIHELERTEFVQCIVFEYLSGGSLRNLIHRAGTLGIDQIGSIAKQIAEGLAYAHARNIVHRDIKSDNILFNADGIPKITDFGLSKIKSSAEFTASGTIAGTVAYASPEQLEGRGVDQRTDLWSFGVVLYEMLTCRLPFSADSQASTVYAIMTKEPMAVSAVRSDAPECLIAIVARCLEKDPEKRYQSAAEILRDLEYISAPGRQPAARSPAWYWWIAVLTGAALLVYLFFPDRSLRPEIPSVAVLYMKNLGPEADEPLSYGITQDLIVDLARAGRLRVSPMKDVMQYKNASAGVEEIAQRLDVASVVEGSIFRQDSIFKISAQLVNIRSKQTLWADRFSMKMKDLPALQSLVALSVLRALGVTPSPQTERELSATSTHQPEAYEHFLQARYRFENKSSKEDVRAAEQLFENAIALDDKLVAARIGLGEVYAFLGDYDNAAKTYTAALTNARIANERSAEAACYRGIGDLHANKGEYPEALEQYYRALAIVREIGDRSGEGKLLNNIGTVYWNQTDYANALEHYSASLRIWQELGDRSGEAKTLLSFGVVHWGMYDFKRALDDFTLALQIAAQIHDLDLEGNLLNSIANVYEGEGDYQNALAYYERSLTIQQQLGNRRGEGRALGNIGLIFRNLGQYDNALQYFRQAEQIHTALNNRKNLGIIWNNMGLLFDERGDSAKAGEYHRKSIAVAQETGDKGAEAFRTQSLGLCELHERRMADAIAHFQESENIFLQLADTVSALTSASWLALGRLVAGDTAIALTDLLRAEMLMSKLKNLDEPIVVWRNCARVMIGAGKTASGQTYLQKAHDELLRRAAKIAVDSLRRSYLGAVALHREIIATWNARKEIGL